MSKSQNRPFSWTRSERANQEEAQTQINSIAEEYEIEVFSSGAEQFADRIVGGGLKPSDYTVAEFQKFKNKVADAVVSALVEAEREAFEFIRFERLERIAKESKK